MLIMGELAKVINIGKTLEKQLLEVGIKTFADLKVIESKTAWLKIRDIDSQACYNRLCSLEGAIQGKRWHDLSENDKQKLRDFFSQIK